MEYLSSLFTGEAGNIGSDHALLVRDTARCLKIWKEATCSNSKRKLAVLSEQQTEEKANLPAVIVKHGNKKSKGEKPGEIVKRLLLQRQRDFAAQRRDLCPGSVFLGSNRHKCDVCHKIIEHHKSGS